jgi:hypothetical protein
MKRKRERERKGEKATQSQEERAQGVEETVQSNSDKALSGSK